MLIPILAAFTLSATTLPNPDPPERARCSIGRPDGRQWTPDLANTRSLVRQADVIVRARAVRGDSIATAAKPSVTFQVLDVLLGDSVSSEFSVYGWLTTESDFNPDSVPYIWIRREGHRGMCFAFAYQRGGEFLLLLRRAGESDVYFAAKPGQLTPYWAPLSPTNEQLRGANDPWVEWVRAELHGESSQ